MIFTIGVTTMPKRASSLTALIAALGAYEWPVEVFSHELGEVKRWSSEDVEIVAYLTKAYDGNDALSYGGKRNVILDIARGEYIAFHDDDDAPHPDYIPRILEALQSKPDVVGFKVACYGYAQGCTRPDIMEPADVSTKYDNWYNKRNGFEYVRCPHHLAPTRTIHARAIKYRGHHGEDYDYAIRMHKAGLLKREVYIDLFMYTYLFDAKKQPGQ